MWENAQAPFYKGYTNLWQHFSLCLGATVGDVAITLLLYALVIYIRKDFWWIRKIRLPDILILLIAGGIVAIGIEKWALNRKDWEYTFHMPVIPFLHVGLFPLLQLLMLPLLTFLLSRRIVGWYLSIINPSP